MVWVPKQQNRARGSARQFWGVAGGGRGEIWLGRTRFGGSGGSSSGGGGGGGGAGGRGEGKKRN